ncbi:OLC1v1015596C1 [Oldenlandia corymbosa var. corymbosa]|uniref:OLC1v1015596C1 n=1 Tax=Oldenlandia corymbosa var. corymbosa TaxID=529605 RepID=A0AAV1E6R5_OLDCO|nr:OLC1v1015596C1 [Oldenlandia corymbosa var. corymbosa]
MYPIVRPGVSTLVFPAKPPALAVDVLSGTRPCTSNNTLCHLTTSVPFSGRFLTHECQDIMEKRSPNTTSILFCGTDFSAFEDYTREYVQDLPFIKVDDVPFVDVPSVIKNYDICVPKNMRLNSEIISQAKRLKLILQFGVGLEGIDISAATKHGIKVARIPSGVTGNADSCAEMAIFLMLGLLRKQNEMQIAVKQKILGEPVGDTLMGKTVLIMGFGRIGISLAKRLRPFGVKIIATKRSWGLDTKNEEENDLVVDVKGSHEDIYNFAGQADIVVCCLQMNTETAAVINEAFISSMKKGAFLVNIARGGLLNYQAVFHHLKSGHLGGLGMDVAWTEPFDPDDDILKFPNVIITPHVAGLTEPSCRYTAKVVGDVALQLHSGKPLKGIEVVN